VLVLLIGASGAGKSTFARAHFAPTQILSSDAFRGMVADDECDQTATPAAFRVLHAVANARLQRGLTTVIDATNVRRSWRRPLIARAAKRGVPVAAIVLDVPLATLIDRGQARADRDVDVATLREQHEEALASVASLHEEGISIVHVLSPADVARARVTPAAGTAS
jgi:predicted kinase